MTNFVFSAPSLYDPDAIPDPNEGYLNEGREFGERLAKQKRLALWLKDQLEAHGVNASDVAWDESGWGFSVNGKNGFVMVLLDSGGGGDAPFDLVVAEMSKAKSEYERTLAAFSTILSDSPETKLIKIVG
jgi:hypothetical protein